MSRSEKGFTLIEVLVAVVIVGIVGAATAESIRSTTNLLGENQRHAEAIVLAQETIENLRTVPYEEIRSDTRKSDDGTMTVSTDVLVDNPDPGMKQIVVTASWEWKGEPRNYELRSVYAKLTRD